MNNNELVAKYQELKSKHAELTSEKLKYEAKREQLVTEIKSIQDKYPEYDLSTVDKVEALITKLTSELTSELADITEQFNKIKVM